MRHAESIPIAQIRFWALFATEVRETSRLAGLFLITTEKGHVVPSGRQVRFDAWAMVPPRGIRVRLVCRFSTDNYAGWPCGYFLNASRPFSRCRTKGKMPWRGAAVPGGLFPSGKKANASASRGSSDHGMLCRRQRRPGALREAPNSLSCSLKRFLLGGKPIPVHVVWHFGASPPGLLTAAGPSTYTRTVPRPARGSVSPLLPVGWPNAGAAAKPAGASAALSVREPAPGLGSRAIAAFPDQAPGRALPGNHCKGTECLP